MKISPTDEVLAVIKTLREQTEGLIAEGYTCVDELPDAIKLEHVDLREKLKEALALFELKYELWGYFDED